MSARTIGRMGAAAVSTAIALGSVAVIAAPASAEDAGWGLGEVQHVIENEIGAAPVAGECEAITTGAWIVDGELDASAFAQPDRTLLDEGAWLGYEAYVDGAQVSVQYYSCFGSGEIGGGGEPVYFD